MPYPNQHSCVIREKSAFKKDGEWATVHRKHNGKTYDVVRGQLKSTGEMTDQSYRYPTKTWTEAEARSHCTEHDGIRFEPATDEEGSHVVADRYRRCAGQHFGMWLIEPHWFAEAVSAVKAGMYPMVEPEAATEGRDYETDEGGIAIIRIDDFMMKYPGSFGGTSTVRVRRAVRKAANDDSVKAILLHIDSPGGTCAGTADLADDIRKADGQKPVYAYIEDLGASAAYWVASQARRVAGNATGRIGSIGTLAIVEDTSGKAEKEGVKVHVVSTGAYKGAFVDGVEVPADHLEDLQQMIEALNEHFLAGVKQGRHLSIAQVRKLADGRLHIAAKAQEIGLIDAVMSLDDYMTEIRKAIKPVTQRRDRASLDIRLLEAE